MLYIRADANDIIATGHIMRCCSISEAVKSMGEDVTFIVADEIGEELISERGYPSINLNSKWNDLDYELEYLKELIQKYSITNLLIDTYYVTKRYLHTLNKITQVTYIDDLHQMIYPCSRLINYSVYADKYSYHNEYKHTELLLGCDFAPLRLSFQNITPKEIKQEIQTILVLTGGTDSYHFIYRFLKCLIDNKLYENIHFNMVCGKYNKDYIKIKETISKLKNVDLYKNIKNMEVFMKNADLAISAGGSTLYELCACGTPTICCALADNQIDNVKGFYKKGIMYYCGDIRTEEECFAKIEKQIAFWMKNPRERKAISDKMQKFVDGHGAIRIAESLLRTEIKL